MLKEKSKIISVGIDRNLCDRQGICVESCPEVFQFDKNDHVQVVQSEPSSDLRKKVEFARYRCPKWAINITYA